MAATPTNGLRSTAPIPQISGYLHKKAKNGKWQSRWFESQGFFLTYYKNKRMEKLLAALNLPQVGEIKLVDPDTADEENDGSMFTIELNERVYTMKAASREEASRWVEVLRVLQGMDQDESRSGVGANGGGNELAPIVQSGLKSDEVSGAAGSANGAGGANGAAVAGEAIDRNWTKGEGCAALMPTWCMCFEPQS